MAGGPERGCGATLSLRTNRVMVEALNKVTQRKRFFKNQKKIKRIKNQKQQITDKKSDGGSFQQSDTKKEIFKI